MSYARNRLPRKIAQFEVISLISGNTVAWAESPDEVRILAEDYQMNPDIAFVGIDDTGYSIQTWALDEVLNGYFDRDIEKYHEPV